MPRLAAGLLLALGFLLAVASAQPARAGLTSPQAGITYVIPPDQFYKRVRLDWNYPVPNPDCARDPETLHVTHYWKVPGFTESINGGGTVAGPHDPPKYIDLPKPGHYTSRTDWACTIDAPPKGPSGSDYNLWNQPLETITYRASLYGKVPPNPPPPKAQPQLSYKESLLKLCGSRECYAKGSLAVEALKAVIKTVIGDDSKQEAAASASKWVTVGEAKFKFAGKIEPVVKVSLKPAARKAFKRDGSLQVRITQRASFEDTPTKTTRTTAKLRLSNDA